MKDYVYHKDMPMDCEAPSFAHVGYNAPTVANAPGPAEDAYKSCDNAAPITTSDRLRECMEDLTADTFNVLLYECQHHPLVRAAADILLPSTLIAIDARALYQDAIELCRVEAAALIAEIDNLEAERAMQGAQKGRRA